MAEWITDLVETWGYWGVALLMFLENVFPPIPSEVIMPLAGFGARRGQLAFAGICLAGTAGSVAGQLPLYYLGRVWGEVRFRRFVERHGRWLLLDVADVDRASAWFDRYGMRAVLFCRFVPGVRSLISIPAGIRGLPLAPFLAWSAVGMGLWATALAAVGHVLGEHYGRVEGYLGPVSYAVFALLASLLIVRAVRRRSRRPRATEARP